jgi:hypothetical protein
VSTCVISEMHFDTVSRNIGIGTRLHFTNSEKASEMNLQLTLSKETEDQPISFVPNVQV